MTADGLLELPGTGWHLWSSAILRTAGFPADGLDRLAAPDCAKAADEYLAGLVDASAYRSAFEAATGEAAQQLRRIAADPLFREAVTWQSLNSLEALDGLLRTGPQASRNYRLRSREIVVTRYWQRYCAKNDTIGFFGPVCWAGFAPDGSAGHVSGGPDLLRERVVEFEWRALTAFVRKLAADPRFQPWLALVLPPQLALDGDLLLRTGAAAQRLSPAAAIILALTRVGATAAEVAALAVAQPRSGLRKEADAHLLIDQLVGEGLLRRGPDLPQDKTALQHLRGSLEALGEPGLRSEALAALERLTAARDEIACAAGDPDAIRAGLTRLELEYTAVTGMQARHRPGATYAGRAVVYEDAVRDLDVVFGPQVRAGLAALGPVLHAARWLTATIAEAYLATARELYDEAGGAIQLSELSFLANGIMLTRKLPEDIMAEFTRRWWQAIGGADLTASRIEVNVTRLQTAVEELFPASAPGWGTARLHSPDIHLCAEDAQALARGDFTAVLGELHVAWLTCDAEVFARFHPRLEALREAVQRDVGDRVVLRYPPDYPEFTARLAPVLAGPGDTSLVYADAPAAPAENLLPLAALTVSVVDDRLLASAPDGRTWPLTELFSPFLSAMAADAFKLIPAGPHTPRVTIDRVVVQRETWRTTVGETGLAPAAGESQRYLAVRAWRDRLGLPERIFAKLGNESKPVYVDLTGPASVASFVAMVRSAGGDDVPLVLSEMLPTPQQAWVSDAQGRRYFSELRMTLRDPEPGGPR
ncbi:hypothetical protein Rhe02_71180 [Rhizocola hellebori]|uniref:Lantibiotic dehydratase N-terminal domain-containing protein n=1 Tax=Rhizocola hellebori TaxID=1392758 RepID=A0A8J3QGT4_9ACTN|nr:lantibiotic dehydratase [Rhizocola hellebori]GIH09051.1 hypothetical protein Rhe02_71180 [Rhizocola hellebori]